MVHFVFNWGTYLFLLKIFKKLKIDPINLVQVVHYGWPGLKNDERELKPKEVRWETDHKAGIKIPHNNVRKR